MYRYCILDYTYNSLGKGSALKRNVASKSFLFRRFRVSISGFRDFGVRISCFRVGFIEFVFTGSDLHVYVISCSVL